MEVRRIELLAPAKNLECGMEAVNHGADAVYIGGPQFGARAAAGNSLEDIAQLVEYAHLYRVKVYVTVNTILKEEELPQTEQMIWDLYRVGVDALIVQDMAITKMNLPPISLHASTQMDSRTPEKVKFLADAGFEQVVLPREFTLEQIRRMYQVSSVPLEVFVHGALCVSYSGQCYISQACYGRSANRGECAQFCRLAFDMVDANGKTIARNKHLLSLKDLNQSDRLEELLDAGASSLKIEGRLKDVSYVKNVTAYYRQRLDAIFKRRKEYVKASSGMVQLSFTPLLEKSFNRGFTHHFLSGRSADIFSFDTPKSLGEEMGTVKEVRGNYLTVAGVKAFHNGDGVCYLDEKGVLQGFRINRADNNKLYPQEMPRIAPRTPLFRNFDQEFEKVMQRKSAERKLEVSVRLGETASGFTLAWTDEDKNTVTQVFPMEKEKARTSQMEQIRTQLSKLGNTPFVLSDFTCDWTDDWFVPSSVWSDWRRQGVERLLQLRKINSRTEGKKWQQTQHPYPVKELTYLGNVMNSQAEAFYLQHGVVRMDPAYEKEPVKGVPLMFCKHCLRFSMGWCPKQQNGRLPYKEPYYLVSSDGKRFRLEFDCQQCQMKLYHDEKG